MRNSWYAVAAWLALAAPAAGQERPRDDLAYRAEFVDGARRAADTITPWVDVNQSPSIDGWTLFDANRPVRWLFHDVADNLPPPESFLEMAGGDCLPGRVVSYSDGVVSPSERVPAHFVVGPYVTIDWPDNQSARNPRGAIEVRTDWVRRIVWTRAAAAYQPRTAFFTDGRQIDFRAARFGATSVKLLREGGIVELSFDELAELHLAEVDPWQAYYEQAAALSPDGAARLVEIITVDGLRARSSTARFQAKAIGDANKPQHWWHLIQPAWSLEPIAVNHERVRLRRYFQPWEVPLSAIAPAAVRQAPLLAGASAPAVDANVDGGTLTSGGQEYQWGLGVQAAADIEFSLPAAARSFRTGLGLDRLAGNGGCIRASVLLAGAPEKTLWASDFVIGSAQALDTGALALGPPGAAQRLVLRCDAAHEGRPAGADPLDIRDVADWLQPLVLLDPEETKRELARHAVRLVPAWNGWQVDAGAQGGVRLVNFWDDHKQARTYRLLALAGPSQPLRLTGKFWVRPGKERLLVATSRPAESSESRIEVSVAGQQVADFAVKPRQRSEGSSAEIISLAEHEGKPIEIEVRQRGADERAAVEWRALALVGSEAPAMP